MTERRNTDGRSEDPGDITSLLAGLRDPGPVPSDLMDRINASLATERLQMTVSGQASQQVPPSGSPHHSSARRAWLLPAAAAGMVALGGAGAVVAAGVGHLVPTGPGASRVAASLAPSSNSAPSSSSTQTRFRHTDSGRRYTWSGLGQQIREQWAADPLDASASPSRAANLLFTPQPAGGVTASSSIDTLSDAQRCLDALGQSVRGSVWVDEGRLGARDVTVIATGTAHSGWSVAVVEGANCAPIGAVRQVPPPR